MKTANKIFAAGTAALALLGAHHAAHAALFTTNAAGDWNDSARWTPNSGPPGSGDHIAHNHATTVTADALFGDGTGVNTSTGNPTITINSGVSLTHIAGSKFTRNGAFSGAGTFINLGHYTETFRGTLNDTVTFENHGILQVEQQWISLQAGTTLRLLEGSTLRKTTGSESRIGESRDGVLTTLDSGNTLRAANFDVQAGKLTFDARGTGQVKFGTLSVANGATLRLASANITYSSANANIFAVDGKIEIAANFRVASNFTFNATQGVDWSAGNIFTNGHTVTNASGNTVTATTTILGTGTAGVNGVTAGRFVNNGTHNITGRPFIDAGATYENNGIYDVKQNDFGHIRGAFENNGLFKKSGGTGEFKFETGGGIFTNTGTVEVSTGTFSLFSAVDTTQFYTPGTRTLTKGTWRMLAPIAGTAVFNLQDASSQRIHIIGADASVVLENSGATFNHLDTFLTTIDGSLLVHGTKNLVGSSAVTVGATGTLGGTGAITTANLTVAGDLSPGASIGTFVVNGNVGFSGGTMLIELGGNQADVLDVNGVLNLTNAKIDFSQIAPLTSSVFIFASYDSLIGTFAPENIFNAPGFINYAFEGNNIALIIPEPASLGLLAAGALLLIPRRPRSRA